MNAYRQEDPIRAIQNAGFIELMDPEGASGNGTGPVYSFLYSGQAGTLDYAFASSALLESVQRAFIWHVNAVLPANMAMPQPWMRFSDHDPVVVDIRLRQSSTSD
jgi:predicted extracellular nuclease